MTYSNQYDGSPYVAPPTQYNNFADDVNDWLKVIGGIAGTAGQIYGQTQGYKNPPAKYQPTPYVQSADAGFQLSNTVVIVGMVIAAGVLFLALRK